MGFSLCIHSMIVMLCNKDIFDFDFDFDFDFIWNNILKHEIDISASDHLFAKNIKGLILQKLLWSDIENCSPSLKLLLLYN